MGLDRLRRKRSAAAVLACAALAAAGTGCGGGKHGAVARDATTTGAPAATGATAPPAGPTTPWPGFEDPVELALSALLARDDFPDGWSKSGAAREVGVGLLPECLPSAAGTTVAAPAFSDGSGQVLQAIQLFPHERSARQAVAELATPSGRDCVAASLIRRFRDAPVRTTDPGGIAFGEPEQEEFATPPLLGDDAVGIRTCLPVTENGERVLVCSELSLYRVARAVTLLEFGSVSDPFPEQLRDELAVTAVDRLDHAIAAATRSASPPPSAGGDPAERAESVLPRLSDLPAGWTAAGRAGVETGVPFVVGAGCRLPDDPAEASAWSPEFAAPDAPRTMTWSVAVLPDEQAARRLFDAFDSRRVRDCLLRDFGERMRSEAPRHGGLANVGRPRASAFEPPALGVDVSGQRMSLTMTTDGAPTTAHADVITLRSGRAVATAWLLFERLPAEQEAARALLALTAERLRAAGG